MKNFIQDADVIDVVLAADVVSGGVVVVGQMAGVAVVDGLSGETISVNLEGAYSLPKNAPLVITQGDEVFWDATPGEVTKTSTGNTPLGIAWKSALSADTTVQVKLLAKRGDQNSTIGQAAAVADIATADASDLSTAQALANATKTKVNALLASLRAAGLLAS